MALAVCFALQAVPWGVPSAGLTSPAKLEALCFSLSEPLSPSTGLANARTDGQTDHLEGWGQEVPLETDEGGGAVTMGKRKEQWVWGRRLR